MTKYWVNILSAPTEELKNALPILAKSPSVPIYSSVDDRVIGKTLSYEVRDEVDLWSEIEVEDGASDFSRAAGILSKIEAESKKGYVLSAVLATNLSRGEIVRLKF